MHSAWFAAPAEVDLQAMAAASPNKATPFFVLHGEDDEVVEPSCAIAAVDHLKSLGFDEVHTRTFADLPHQMSKQSLGQSIDFLLARLPVGGAPSARTSGSTDASAPPAAKST